MEYKIFLNYSCCGKCCCRGYTNCNAFKIENSDYLFFFFFFFLLFLTLFLVIQLKKALDKVCANYKAAYQALYASIACLEYVERQAKLLEKYKALMLLKKAQAIKNLKKLKCLKTETKGSESSCSKKLYYKGSDTDPSSLNVQAVVSNLTISAGSANISDLAGRVNSSVDLFCFFFWNFFLANFFSSEVVDSLASGSLNFRDGTS